MELIIRNISNQADKKLFVELARRLGLKADVLSEEAKEDHALVKEMIQARKMEFVSKEDVLTQLNKWK